MIPLKSYLNNTKKKKYKKLQKTTDHETTKSSHCLTFTKPQTATLTTTSHEMIKKKNAIQKQKQNIVVHKVLRPSWKSTVTTNIGQHPEDIRRSVKC